MAPFVVQLRKAIIAGGFTLLAPLEFGGIVRGEDGNETGRMKVPNGGTATVQTDVTPKPPTSSPVPTASGRLGNDIPPPAVAPFDAKTARAHQEAWAKHLGVKVETPNSVGQTMILIPPGEFLMGSTDAQVEAALKAVDELEVEFGEQSSTEYSIQKAERPQHKVVITKPFLMSTTEVTIGQFKKFAAAADYLTAEEKRKIAAKTDKQPSRWPIRTYLDPDYAVTDDSPAEYISWNDAAAYCNWLTHFEPPVDGSAVGEPTTSRRLGMKYRLPTEAEWEYACRAGTTTQYSFGDDRNELPKYGWHNMNAGGRSHPVGTLLPNPFGLFDMHGNLREWCGDWYVEKWYSASPPNDPVGLSAGVDRVVRGGDWFFLAVDCRSAFRSYGSRCGFRVVAAW